MKGSLASKALDGALAEAFGAMSTGAGRRLTSQLVVGPALAQTLAIGGRRLRACALFFSLFFFSFYSACFSLFSWHFLFVLLCLLFFAAVSPPFIILSFCFFLLSSYLPLVARDSEVVLERT